jgi:hypothetical protein
VDKKACKSDLIMATWKVRTMLIPGKMQEFGNEIRKCKLEGKGKGKEIPLQALTGPEGSSRLRLPDFKTIGT